MIDRDLYVRDDWFEDLTRMAAAGFPADHAFATKVVDGGLPAAYEPVGSALRHWLSGV